jgi:hypothetical protein
MRVRKVAVVVSLLSCLACTLTLAQPRQGPPLVVEVPPRDFATSEEHYNWLKEQAGGGTTHTMASVPQWPGLWEGGGNTVFGEFFREGQVVSGILTPAYEAAFSARRREIAEKDEQGFDRLALCEPPGYPRHLWEPYTREFANLPHQSWQMNDVFNETRRIYIGKEHSNLYGTHSWLGDTIGFWDGNKLVTNTKYLLPADYSRGQPLTSNQFESVETWELKTLPDGSPRLEVQVTFYDPYSLVKPLHGVYAFRPATALMEADARIVYWECATTNNAYLSEDGTTQFRLPGEPGYKDPRGYTLFPDVPGQSRDPLNNTPVSE